MCVFTIIALHITSHFRCGDIFSKTRLADGTWLISTCSLVMPLIAEQHAYICIYSHAKYISMILLFKSDAY